MRASGDGQLDWPASDDAGWLTPDASAGTTPGEIGAIVDPSGLGAGTYPAQIAVATGAGTETVLRRAVIEARSP